MLLASHTSLDYIITIFIAIPTELNERSEVKFSVGMSIPHLSGAGSMSLYAIANVYPPKRSGGGECC